MLAMERFLGGYYRILENEGCLPSISNARIQSFVDEREASAENS